MTMKKQGQIAWKEAGNPKAPEERTLIFLHAMAGTATAWTPQMDLFSDSKLGQ